MSYEYKDTYLLIYRAVFTDDWNFVSKTFEEFPDQRTEPINRQLETPLMIAVATGRSHDFVKRLLSSLSTTDGSIASALDATNNQGETVLHYAAMIGNMKDAELLVRYSGSNLERFVATNYINGSTPLSYASWHGRKNKMLEFFFSKMGVLNTPTITWELPTQRSVSGNLLIPAIEAEFLDLALKLVTKHSDIILSKSGKLHQSLEMLTKRTELFPSGSRLGFWGRLIYSMMPVHESKIIPDYKKTTSQQYEEFSCCNSTSTTVWFKRILQFIASPITNIYDMKITHRQVKQLVKHLCTTLVQKKNEDTIWAILGSNIFSAVEFGNYEVIEECILAYPSIIWATFFDAHLFHLAIGQRQEKIYNLVYQMSSYKAFIANHVDHKTGENALHMAAKLAPPHRLNIIKGAALQMQRELQWFKEIETNFVQPAYKNVYNNENKTPRMVFTDAHKDLLKEGQEWMKNMASSSTVVATLIVTMAFSVAFAVPGGNKNEGNPVYLDRGAFMLFIISDAIALFSSATLVLMFLGILTSRYAEDDFLYMLPKRMTIGLVFLFLSLAATLVAFSATLSLMLQDKVTWIAAPLLVVTSIPVGLFGVLQFPLLSTMVYSTYGPSIFRMQDKRLMH